jgi:hypothetical protein
MSGICGKPKLGFRFRASFGCRAECPLLGWLDGSAPEDVSANLGEINEAPRRSAPKPHADLHA